MIEVRGWGLVGLRVRDGTGTVPYGDIVNPICRGDPCDRPLFLKSLLTKEAFSFETLMNGYT